VSKVGVRRYCACPFSAVIDLAEKALRQHPQMRVSPLSAVSENVETTAAVVDDHSDSVRRHDALLLAWRPDHPRLFPEFRGVLTARPKHRGVWLRLHGSYDPPLGFLGKAFDLVFGRAIARATMARLLAQLSAEIAAQYADTRARGRDVTA